MADRAKAVLVARLAVERAHLWLGCLGLSEETLVRQPVFGEWTTKDLLARAAAWDSIRAVQIGLLQAGRLHQIHEPDVYAFNTDLFRQRRRWPLDFVVDDAENARARLLLAVNDLSWDDIAREQVPTTGARYSVEVLLRACAEHDARHAADFQAWRHGCKLVPGPKIVLSAGLEACRASLLVWRQALAPASYTAECLCDDWTWQDIIGHLADWNLLTVRTLAVTAAGQPTDRTFAVDEMGWIESHAAARRGEPYLKTWEDGVRAYRDLATLLDEMEESHLAQPIPTPVANLSTPYFWFAACAYHYYEHARWLHEVLVDKQS
jgi:hypothetical protein